MSSVEDMSSSEDASKVYNSVQHLLRRPEYKMLSGKETTAGDTLYLSISREVLEDIGPVDSPRLLLKFDVHNVSYIFQVHFTAIESGNYNEELVKARIDQLVPSSGYILCPGLKSYSQSDLHFKPKNLKRFDSDSCLLFHIPHNGKLHPHHYLNNMCAPCKRLSNEISQLKQKNAAVTTAVKLQRQMPNSKYPLSLLSPTSLDKRNRSVINERKKLKKKVEKYESDWNHHLSDEQSLQLAKIMQIIDVRFPDELQSIFSEADEHQGGEQLRKEWNQDKLDHLKFFNDQVRNGVFFHD